MRSAINLFVLLIAIGGFSCRERDSSHLKTLNGTPATNGQFPSSVRLSSLLCGGTVVAKKKILTAAHCVLMRNKPELSPYARMGKVLSIGHGVDASFSKDVNVTITSVDVHPTVSPAMQKLIASGQTGDTILAEAVQSPDVFDLALITADQELAIPAAEIHENPIEVGTKIILQGYGTPSWFSRGPGQTLRFFLKSVDAVSSAHLNFLVSPLPHPKDYESIDEAARESSRESLAKSTNMTAGDSGGAGYLDKGNSLKIACVNSGGDIRNEVHGLDVFTYLEAFGFDGQEIQTRLIHPVILGNYNCARVDSRTGEPSVYHWINSKL